MSYDKFQHVLLAELSVSDVTTATVRGSQIAEVTKLSVGVFAPTLHSSPLNHWLELMCKDVILISSNVCFYVNHRQSCC